MRHAVRPKKKNQPNRSRGPSAGYGLFYLPRYVTPKDREAIVKWLATIWPIWEERYAKNHPAPPGEPQRKLLRPVYWLGNWQFACLNYYHPPMNVDNCCVKAEPFPPVLAKLVAEIEKFVRSSFAPADVPKSWHFNTCLVNFYGSQLSLDGKKVDVARVGEHKDFEPGPVASISLGERAVFQFVASRARGSREGVVLQQWLEDSSLQIFGGRKFKSELFHRVQRVEDKRGELFPTNGVNDFETRRINFTFRYVPDEHIIRYKNLPKASKEDVLRYMSELSKKSEFFRKELLED